MSLSLISLDPSYPTQDTYRDTNTAGIMRFIDATDSIKLPALQRMQGDLVHRDNLLAAKINEIVVEVKTNPAFPAFDNSPYILRDGTRAFLAAVSGVTPTAAAHLSTKEYTDTRDAEVLASVSDLQSTVTTYLASAAVPFYSPWYEHEWHSGQQDHVEMLLTIPDGLTPNYTEVSNVTVVERLDIAQITVEDPSPDPIYVYQALTPGANYGFKLDAVWLDPESGKVHVLIPNVENHVAWSGITQYTNMQVPRTRHLRAIVTAPTL